MPAGARPELPLTAADLARFRRMTAAEMAECVLSSNDIQYSRATILGRIEGVAECPVVGPASVDEAVPAGKMSWPHGFHVRRLQLQPGARIPGHARHEEEVIFIHRGELTVSVGKQRRVLGPGDLVTTPIGATRSFGNAGETVCDLIVVRGGNAPRPPDWSHA